MRAAEITVERVSCESLTVKITITAYLDTNSGVAFGGNTGDLELLYFGDGGTIRVPEIPTTPRPDLGVDVGVAQFIIEHRYSSQGIYEISYGEANRNDGVLNISGSSNQSLFVKTQIHVASSDCNHFPELLIPPVDRGCSGVAFFHSIGVYDADGDSLSYELVIPIGNNGQPTQYKSPDDPSFYSNYSNEEGAGPVIFSIDPITGLLTWDAGGVQGEYNIAIKITEWRNDPETGEPIMMSSIIRDMQIIIEDCDNNRPDLIIPQDTCIVAGSMLDLTIYGTDQDQHPVKIEAYSELFELSPESIPATYSPDPFETLPSNPPAELAFNWNTSCSHVRDRPYQVVFKITDQPPSGTKLVTYKTWNIKVVAPKPVWQNIVPDLVNRNAQLNWENYTCDNAQSIQIWRRVDEFGYDAGNCGGESLPFMGYELLAEVDPTNVQYLDTNGGRKLSVGAKYCYRLAAQMPNGSVSLISEELCIDPILVDAPVITHVTVETTSYKDGKIRISWRSPFEISKVQYPGPYQYEVYRGEGLDQSGALTAVDRITDTTFVDVGLNTEEKVFHYTIVLYSRTINNSSYSPVDTSSTASSIKLITTPGTQSVSIKWDTNVPWSNYSQNYPRHLIYRGEYGTPEDQLILIDSVDVLQQGLSYVDLGNYQNTA